MLHAKFQDHRTSDSGKEFLKLFTIYGCGVHLGHMTLCIYTNFRSQSEEDAIKFIQTFVPNSEEDAIKFGFDWQSGFREDL